MADTRTAPASAIVAADTTTHLHPDPSIVFTVEGPEYLNKSHIVWIESYLDLYGHKVRQFHREGHPAMIIGTNLDKLADLTVTECGPAPSKDGTPVYVSSIRYNHHGLSHRDEGPSFTGGTCTYPIGRCERVRVWRQHGKCRTDRPFRVTCNEQVWASRTCRPTTVYRDGRLFWPSSAPERYTFWVHGNYSLPVRRRFRAIAAASSVPGLANLLTWWVDE
jgi:hypothetical protein